MQSRRSVRLFSSKYYLVAFGLITCSLFGVGESMANPRHDAMLEKLNASQYGTIPVIVQFGAEDKAKRSQLLATSKMELLQRRLAVAKLSGVASPKIKTYKNLPFAAMQVDRGQLEALLSDSTLRVHEDKLKRPSLAQSVNRVYPSKDISPFHGNNQWAVAVLDTGINKNHSFLSGKVISEACYSDGGGQPSTISLCPGGVVSSTAINSGLPCTISGCGHGTQVAGIAVGNGSSFDGVARDAKLISVQVYSRVNDESFCFPSASCVGAYTSDIIAGLERIYELRNTFDIAAVNISLGSDELFSGACDDQPEKPIIDLLRAAKIAVVAATGNAGDTTKMQSPACISSAFAVAATSDSTDVVFANNNTSNQLDLFAPGINITSSNSNGGFSTGSGTSLAAPHVAGAWAVIKSASPTISVTAASNLLKTSGPVINQNSILRRRLDLRTVLEKIQPGSQFIENSESFLPAIFLLLLGE